MRLAILLLVAMQANAQERVPVRESIHPEAQPEFDKGKLDDAARIGYATLILRPTAAKQSELERLLQDQQDRTSPDYHLWLTPEQFGDRFGLSGSDYEKLAAWLKSAGLQIENRARARNWIAFSGTAQQVESAFHTEIHRYLVDGKMHFANASEVSIPSLPGIAEASVRGFNDFENGRPQYTSANGTNSMAPDDWATIYDVAPLYKMGIDGTGMRIGIIGRSDLMPADIAQFRATFGLPPSTIEQHLIGPDPGFTDAAGEAGLDVEWSGAIARNAQIVFIYAGNFNDAAQAAVDQNLAPVMSQSFSICEPTGSQGTRSIAQQANAQGITFMASSGDSGPAGCDPHGTFGTTGGLPASGGIAVNMPSSFPEVTAVGGTQFNEGTGTYWSGTNSPTGESALSYIPEMVWNQSGASGLLTSGGGASIFFPKPGWQVGAGVPNDGARDIPDISFAASGAGHDAYLVIRNGAQNGTGGTSAATPSFAGVVALLNQYLVSQGAITKAGLGNINPQLYRLAAKTPNAFHDITVGSNIVQCVVGSPGCTSGSYGFNAGPGYDLATGLGSLDVYNFVTDWSGGTGPTTTSVTANPGSIALGGTVQLTATVSAGTGVPTGSVAFSTGSTALGMAPLTPVGNSAMATLTVSGPLLAAGSATAAATYSGDANFNGSTGTTLVSVTTPASGSSVRLSITPNPAHQGQGVQVTLTEMAGVATTVTGWTINGVDDSALIANDFEGTVLAAYGSLSTSIITVAGGTFPTNKVYVFTGVDASGRKWTATDTLVLVGPLSTPELALSSVPATVQQNPAATAGCQWKQQLLVQEQNGLEVQLTKLMAGGVDISTQLQQLFGTTALAPFGMLQATLCTASGSSAPVMYQISGVNQTGNPVTATASATLAGAAAMAGSLSVSQDHATFVAAAGSTTPASASLTVNAQNWTAAIFPANQTTGWLKVATTATQVTVTASAAGLSAGVYNAVVVLQASNTVPQFVEIPVIFAVNAASAVSIAGVSNAASFQQSFAPGMIVSVFGTGLAAGTQAASTLPLPVTLGGVSATVNGVAAPLYYVSPGQLNVQVPYETGSGSAVLGVNNNGVVGYSTFTVSPAAPGIFANPAGALVPYSTAKHGDTLLLFVTGEGTATPAQTTGASPFSATPLALLPHPGLPLSVSVGGVPAALTFVGIPPGIAGATQVNFVVPLGAGLGAQPVVVTVGGVASPPVTLTITQ